MADPLADGEYRAVQLEYRFDRLLVEKLAQAYEVLVPERGGPVDRSQVPCQEALNHENSSHLHARFL
jgi:hypothetical protein